MKIQKLTIVASQVDPEIEEMIQKTEAELEELAQKKALHFALLNKPDPKGDKLVHYTGEFRTKCEKLSARISQKLQPSAQISEGKMDIDSAQDKDLRLEKEIKELENQNRKVLFEIGKFDVKSFFTILFWGTLITFVILLGEVVYNTSAFQVMGDNMIKSMLLSFSISLTATIASHVAAFLYKEARTKLKRRLIVIGSLLIMTGVFIALGSLRSMYLAKHNVSISPFYFVVINDFFFIVSAVLSYFLLPSWPELKENARQWRIYHLVQKRNELIQKKMIERENNKSVLAELNKIRLRIIYYAGYGMEIIRKLHSHAVEVFKGHNLAERDDGETPDCYSDILPEPEMEDIKKLLTPNRKAS